MTKSSHAAFTPDPEGPRWILLVEDDRDLRSALADLLRLEGGFAVSEAEDAVDALLLLRAAEPGPDAVLLDLDLPGMGGAELRARLAADPALADVPVVILSGRVPPGPLAALAVLEKPCRPETLLAVLRRLPARRAARSPTLH